MYNVYMTLKWRVMVIKQQTRRAWTQGRRSCRGGSWGTRRWHPWDPNTTWACRQILVEPRPNSPGARRKKRKRKTAAPAMPAPSLPTGRRTGKVIPLQLKNGSYASLALQQMLYPAALAPAVRSSLWIGVDWIDMPALVRLSLLHNKAHLHDLYK